MQVKPLKSPIINVGDDLSKLLIDLLSSYSLENSVVVVTSKVVSLSEKRLHSKNTFLTKLDLIKKEADFYIENAKSVFNHVITIKHNVLIPSAGIDESNSRSGDYILYPKNPIASAEDIMRNIKSALGIKNLGVIISDSHTTPLRSGVIGVALGWAGIKAQNSYIGKPDIFGRLLECTKVNVIDALAASAVFVMGESNEQTPFALINDCNNIVFTDNPVSRDDIADTNIPFDVDLYAPILSAVKWKKNISQDEN